MPFFIDIAISGTDFTNVFHRKWSRESFHQRGPGRAPPEKAPARPHRPTLTSTGINVRVQSMSSALRPSMDGHSSKRGGYN